MRCVDVVTQSPHVLLEAHTQEEEDLLLPQDQQVSWPTASIPVRQKRNGWAAVGEEAGH